MNNITENQFYDLLALKMSGDASNDQLLLLETQLKLHPEWQFIYDQMLKPGTHVSHELTQQAYAAHIVKMQLQGKFDANNREETAINTAQLSLSSVSHRSVYKKLVYATLIAASFIGLFFILNNYLQIKKPLDGSASLNEVATKKGSKSHIKLPDGTSVWLNADSKLTYSEQFAGNTREVTLLGEAYFDVAHDTSHPFIIHIGKSSIKVLGTAFNVRNYPQDRSWETTLIRGKIEVSMDNSNGEKIIMKPMEKLVIEKEVDDRSAILEAKNTDQLVENKVTLKAVEYSFKDSLIAETSWVDGKLVFVNQPLGKIAEELERQFNVAVKFNTDAVKDYRYTGDFEKESLGKILQILQLSKKLKYTLTDADLIFE
jgi:ferric-dicitrate binding protein FerR (iron transport regulator)